MMTGNEVNVLLETAKSNAHCFKPTKPTLSLCYGKLQHLLLKLGIQSMGRSTIPFTDQSHLISNALTLLKLVQKIKCFSIRITRKMEEIVLNKELDERSKLGKKVCDGSIHFF